MMRYHLYSSYKWNLDYFVNNEYETFHLNDNRQWHVLIYQSDLAILDNGKVLSSDSHISEYYNQYYNNNNLIFLNIYYAYVTF